MVEKSGEHEEHRDAEDQLGDDEDGDHQQRRLSPGPGRASEEMIANATPSGTAISVVSTDSRTVWIST